MTLEMEKRRCRHCGRNIRKISRGGPWLGLDGSRYCNPGIDRDGGDRQKHDPELKEEQMAGTEGEDPRKPETEDLFVVRVRGEWPRHFFVTESQAMKEYLKRSEGRSDYEREKVEIWKVRVEYGQRMKVKPAHGPVMIPEGEPEHGTHGHRITLDDDESSATYLHAHEDGQYPHAHDDRLGASPSITDHVTLEEA